MTADDEAELLAACRANPAEFRTLYERYLPRVYRYLFYRVGERAMAEDLTSQTFLAALEGLAGYRHRGHFAAWLFGIARHKLADHYRRPQGARLSGELAADQAGLLDQVVAMDNLQNLAVVVNGLPEEEQELLRLRYAAELSLAEIAALQGRSLGAVKMSLYRLLARLAAQMAL